MSDLIRSAPLPLFDRLCWTDEAQGATLDSLGLKASIGRELSRLFNTRSKLTFAEFSNCFETHSGTVIDYGVPDFTALSPRSGDDLEVLQNALQQAIKMFEPRLMHTQVKVFSRPVDSGNSVHFGNVQAHIVAAVQMGLTLRRIELDMNLSLRDGTSGVA